MCEICEKARQNPALLPRVLQLRAIHRMCQQTPKTVLVPGKRTLEYHHNPVSGKVSTESYRFRFPIPNEDWEQVHRIEVQLRQELDLLIRGK